MFETVFYLYTYISYLILLGGRPRVLQVILLGIETT